MAGLLENRIAFVTGGAGGIGAATAIAFAAEGAKVAVADLKDPAETVATITAAGGEAYSIALDVTDQAAVEAAVDGGVAKWGRLDIAFNNAGVSLEDYTTPWESVELYDKVVAVNQRGVMLCMAAELRHMAKQGSGSIVNMASLAAQGWPNSSAYTSSKGGIIALTRTLAMELADHKVRVNCISPGVIDTAQPRGGYSEEQLAELVKGTLAKRMGSAEEVASVALFLASDAASFVNGQNIHVNGGVFMA